jgi:predicted XRE-type DNA-binding protein
MPNNLKDPHRLRYENPFDVFTDDPAEAADLQYRARVMGALRDYFKARGLTQSEIGQVLEVPQPRVSELMTGKITTLSSATLNGYMGRLGVGVSVSFEPKPVGRIEARMVDLV